MGNNGDEKNKSNGKRKIGLFGTPSMHLDDVHHNSKSDEIPENLEPKKRLTKKRKDECVAEKEKSTKIVKNMKSKSKKKMKTEAHYSSKPKKTQKKANSNVKHNNVSSSSSTPVTRKRPMRASKFKASRSRTPIRNK